MLLGHEWGRRCVQGLDDGINTSSERVTIKIPADKKAKEERRQIADAVARIQPGALPIVAYAAQGDNETNCFDNMWTSQIERR